MDKKQGKPTLMQPIAFTVSEKYAALPPNEQINATLAELLGWEAIEEDAETGALIGYPVEAEGNKEIIPDWAGDFQEASQLMLSQNVSLDLSEETGVTAIVGYRGKGYTTKREKYEKYGTKGEAVAFAITMALVLHLFHNKRAAETGTVYPGSKS